MIDRRALTRVLVVALVGLALAAGPVRNQARWAWPATVESSTGDRASMTAEPESPPSHLIEQSTDVSPYKVAVTWAPLLAFLAALAVRLPFPGRRMPTSAALVHRDTVRQRPRVPRAPPVLTATS